MAATFDAGALILAGGDSRRMGRNKSLLPYNGVPLIQHIAEQIAPHVHKVSIVANTPTTYAFLGLDVVPDIRPDNGPLMGIASGLRRSEYDWNLVLATDMPSIPVALLHLLFAGRTSGSCLVPQERSGRIQPLCAFYHRTLADKFLSLLSKGEYRLTVAIDACSPVIVPVDTGTLCNLNTPDAYQRAIETVRQP